MRTWLAVLVALAACNTPRSPGGGDSGIVWIEDDYPRALAQARAQDRPIFIDAWAQWCHTCISMKSFIFTERGLAPVSDQFVWLRLDTEKLENAPVVAKFPVSVWPTLFVVDAKDESVKGRWPGSATVPQLREFLAEGRRQVRAGGRGPLAEADAAALAKDWKRAAELYAQGGDRPEVLVSRIEALSRAGDNPACAALGKEKMWRTGLTQSAVDFATFAVSCGDEIGDAEVGRLAEKRLTELLADEKNALAADDRGVAYQVLWEVRGKAGDLEGARRAAEDLVRDLGQAAATAPDAHAASTFNVARAYAYLYLGRGPEAIAMLEASEKALPNDYNPPHQLARVYRELGDLDAALVAVERSLAKAYGPRKGGILGVKADLLEKKGDLEAAGMAYEAQIAFYEALPVEQRPAERLAKAREAAARCRKARAAPAL